MDEAGYIQELVKAGDQDRYWAGLLMAPPSQDHLFALYAFNIELARIGEQVREPQIGEIRLQWWRDALDAPDGALTGNPVADALRTARTAHGLPMPLLAGMIDARGLDVERASIATPQELEAHLIATAGAVFRLGAWIADSRDEHAARASEAAGLCYGLVGLMRALPYHAARGQLYIPTAFLAAFGVESASVLAGEESEALRTALGVLREKAREHLTAFRALAKTLPPRTLPVFLPMTLIPAYLRRLGSPSHSPLGPVAELNPLSRFGRIWLGHLLGRI
jgi:phytoene synthase